MENLVFVYIIVSESNPDRHYTGLTHDLEKRLCAHNAGRVPHSSRHRPWKLETAVAFRSRAKARCFEVYLKSHSGRAFARKRL
jgi:predicted GIY-YIG superfamily endonuclease